MNITELRKSLDSLPILAKNRNLSMHDFIEHQKDENFPDLAAKAFLIAKDWALEPSLPKVAKKHGLKKIEVQEIIQHPLVHAAMIRMRDIYCQHDIIDKAWIKAQRVRALHMAMGDEDIYQIDRNGMQVEGQETNLTAVRGILQDLEKSHGFNSDTLNPRPVFNVISSGTVNIDGNSFLSQFKEEDNAPLDSVETVKYKEIKND